MKRENFDRGWSFAFHGRTAQVDLPHDFSIIQPRDRDSRSGVGNGFFSGGNAEYTKNFQCCDEWRDKTVMLEFEGVYMNATVRLNGHIIATHPYGYTSFHCELNPHLKFEGTNTVSVQVCNDALPNTRWYSGSGIYRHVWLATAPNVRIAPYGLFVSTTNRNVATVEMTVENTTEKAVDVKIRAIIYDAEANVATAIETPTTILPGSQAVVEHISVPDAQLWNIDSPYLYTLYVELVKDGVVGDSESARFGFRTISVCADKGFLLNNTPVKLKGGCVHHDCGILGAASYDRAEERKAELLKQSGYNAVRCAHNPPSPAFLDACDRLGLLVIDEAFDAWQEGKEAYDYHMFFEQWWRTDMTSMILRDRNHPSVVMWSTGNEIVERDGRSDGYQRAKMLADFIRTLDDTRPVTNAICDIWDKSMVTDEMRKSNDNDYWATLTREFAEPLDVVGYNYLKTRYEADGAAFPGRVIACTESLPNEAFEYWEAAERFPYVIGDFVWTALDYLGESGIGRVAYREPEHPREYGRKYLYPYNQANCGDYDICGFKRPQSYYRDFIWRIGREPFIAVYRPEFYGQTAQVSPWGWPNVTHNWTWLGYEGKPISIDVYSDGDEVELFLDGESLGRKPAGKKVKYIASFDTIYKPGELTAQTYLNGLPTYSSVLRTASAPAAIRLSADRAMLTGGFGDLAYITATLVDTDGNVAHHAENQLFFTVSGAGSLLAVGNGNPTSDEMYVDAHRKAYEGCAMVIVKGDEKGGDIIVSAMVEGLSVASIEIRSNM